MNGKDIFLLASHPGSLSSSAEVHKVIAETLFTISALRREGAGIITVVLPYWPYLRQHGNKNDSLITEKDVTTIHPHGAVDMTKMLREMGADRVITLDTRESRIEAFFPDSMPVTNLNFRRYASKALKKQMKNQLAEGEEIIVCADRASHERHARRTMHNLQLLGFNCGEAAIMNFNDFTEPDDMEDKFEDNKSHSASSDTKELRVVGDIRNKTVVLVSDLTDTGRTAEKASRALKAAGAKEVYFVVTHFLNNKGCIDRLARAPIKAVITSNSVPSDTTVLDDKITVIKISKLLAECIFRTHNNIHFENMIGL